MFNMRYHIASLVAVFLALSVGLLLGSVVNERGALDTQREALVSGLHSQYEELAEENRLLKEENDGRGGFIEDTLPLLVKDRLAGKTVLVLTNLGRADGLAATREAILAAGGTPVVVTLQMPGLGLGDPAVSELATAYADPDAADRLASLATMLAEEWAVPLENRPLTDDRIGAGVFAIEEFPATMQADAVVTLSVIDGTADEGAFALAEALAKRGIPAAAAETAAYPTGVAAAGGERGLSAVDDIASSEGIYSLVMILAGRAEGYFGSGDGAGARYPIVTASDE